MMEQEEEGETDSSSRLETTMGIVIDDANTYANSVLYCRCRNNL